MTEIEVAKIIVEQNGYCDRIRCSDCPAYRVYREKGLESCPYLWCYNNDNKKIWFQNWFSKNGDKMKTEKIKELRERLQNITDDQLETIADIIYDKVVDPEQHIIDAYNVFYSESCFTYKEDLFAKKISTGGDYPKVFYAGFKAAEKVYKK